MATRSKNYDPQKRYIDVYNDFSGGINAAFTSTKLKENQFIRLVNLDIDKVGQAVKRYGLKRFNINGIGLHQVVADELKNQWKVSPEKLSGLKINDSFSFFDGVRQVLNFSTNIGVITIIFNQSFTGIEEMDDGTKLVLYYDEMIENVKFTKFMDQVICICSRPETMKHTQSIPIQNKYPDPRDVPDEITVDKEEPVTFYNWNPTNRNKITDTIRGMTYRPIGWVRAFNWNKDTYLTYNIDGKPNEITVIDNKQLPTVNEEYYLNTHPMGNEDNQKIPLKYDFHNNFVDVEGSFEYVNRDDNGNRNVYKYKSAMYGNYTLVIDDIKGRDDFLNFPILFTDGHFHFGGCTRDNFYIWKISIDALRNKKNNLQTIINSSSTKYKLRSVRYGSDSVLDMSVSDLNMFFYSGKGHPIFFVSYETIRLARNTTFYCGIVRIKNSYLLSLPDFYMLDYGDTSTSGYRKYVVADSFVEYTSGSFKRWSTKNFSKTAKQATREERAHFLDEGFLSWNPLASQNNYLSISVGSLYIIKNNSIYTGIDNSKTSFKYNFDNNVLEWLLDKKIENIVPSDSGFSITYNGEETKAYGIYDITPSGITYSFKSNRYGSSPNGTFAHMYWNGKTSTLNNDIKKLIQDSNRNFPITFQSEVGALYYGIETNVNKRLAKNLKEVAENQRYYDNAVTFQAPLLDTNGEAVIMSANSNVGTHIIRSNNVQQYPFIYTKQTYNLKGLATNDTLNFFTTDIKDLLEVFYSVTFGTSGLTSANKTIEVPAGMMLIEGMINGNNNLLRTYYQGFPDYVNGIKIQSRITTNGVAWIDDFDIKSNIINNNPKDYTIKQRIGVSLKMIKAKILVTSNPVYFEPIRLSIIAPNDMSLTSYNIASFDDRQASSKLMMSDISQHADISPWLVQSIPQGDDSGVPSDSYYLSALLPVNQLVVFPKKDSLFKMYYWLPKKKPLLWYKQISMPLVTYNNIFYNDNFDWRDWMIKEGTGLNNIADLTMKKFDIPFGDKEWVVGWATCSYSGGSRPTKESITSGQIKAATLSFIPSDNNVKGTIHLTGKYFNDFLYTDKAVVFANRIVLYGQSNRLFFSDLTNPTCYPLLYVIELPTQEVVLSAVEFGYYLIVSTANNKYIIRGRSFDKSSSNPFTLDNISSDTGSVSSKADKVNGNNLFFLDKTGIKYLYNAFGTAEKEYNFKPVDLLINKYLPKGLKAEGAVATTHNNKYYINYPATKQMFVYDNELQAWIEYQSSSMVFSDMYSQDGILYCVAKNSFDLYWFDKDTYVDNYVGLTGPWKDQDYGPLWRTKMGNVKDGNFQIGTPIDTLLVTRPFVGVDDAHIKAYHDLDILVQSNVPMSYLDIKTRIDNEKLQDSFQMPGGRTPRNDRQYYEHYIGDGRDLRHKWYQVKYPSAMLDQIAFLNYTRLGGTDLSLHRVKIGGRKGYTCEVGILNRTPGSYSIESIKMNYQFRSSK